MIEPGISKQRRYQLRRISEGRCCICGKPRDGDSQTKCLACLARGREVMKRANAKRRAKRVAESAKEGAC